MSSQDKDHVNASDGNGDGRKNGDRRGFASMDIAKQREIAREGGRAAHQKGTAHEFTPDEAREAGRRGGEVVSRNREHMAEIGRKGGEARGRRALERRAAQIPSMTGGSAPQPAGETSREGH